MKPTEAQVEKWLKTKDFNTGINMLFKCRVGMARILQRQGARRIDKLESELKKQAGIVVIEARVTPAKSAVSKAPESKPQAQPPQRAAATDKTPPLIDQKIPKECPPPAVDFYLSRAHTAMGGVPQSVERVAREHARLYMLRSQLSDERLKLPDNNSPEVVKKRKIITQSIHEHSDRIEQLFEAHALYMKNRTLPDIGRLFPHAEKEISEEEPPQGSKKHLQKKRTSLMSSNRRDRTMLNYQSEQVKKKKNPMPEGERRIKIEKRILDRLDKIDKLERVIKQLKE